MAPQLSDISVSQGKCLAPASGLMNTLLAGSGVNANLCFQCRKCSAGCPMGWAMDLTPAQLIHAIRLGMAEWVLHSKTMWLCSACETCTTRCPQEVDIAKLMDACKILAVKQGIRPQVPRVHQFNQAALRNIKWFGRMYELGLIGDLKMRTREFFKDTGLGIKMFLKGKLAVIPSLSLNRILTMRRIFARVKAKEKAYPA